MKKPAVLLACVVLAATLFPGPGASARADRDPVARTDRFSIPEDTALTYTAPGVLSNDRDPEGRRLTVRLVRGPRHGAASLTSRGTLRYTPDNNFSGREVLVYVAHDPAGHRDRARVVITVTPLNDAPSLRLRAQTPVYEGGSSRMTLDATDPEGRPLTYRFDCDGDRTFEVTQDENVHFCPYADDDLDPVVRGRVVDAKGAVSTARLQLTVLNRVPVVAAADDQAAQAGGAQTVDLGSFADPGPDGPWQVSVDWGDGSSSSYSATTAGDLGSLPHTWTDALEVFQVAVTVTESAATGDVAATDSATFSVDVTG